MAATMQPAMVVEREPQANQAPQGIAETAGPEGQLFGGRDRDVREEEGAKRAQRAAVSQRLD